MGEVWKAWDTELCRWVALKFLNGGDDEEIARFKREAHTAGRLSHPNIAAIYEVGESDGRHWIAMQFIPGQTLKAFPRTDTRKLIELVRDAARGLAYAHEEGIVHRDIKPENLMSVTRPKPAPERAQRNVPDVHLFVMDFGLARPAEGASDLSLSGIVVGTPAYMAPEQARGEKVDARADVWSLGATLYELLTDRKPFIGKNVMDTLRRVQEDDPKAPRKIDPRIDSELETIVLKCLEKDRERRYVGAADVANDLDRWLADEVIDARPASMSYRLRKWMKRRRAVVAILTAALVVVALGATVVLRTQSMDYRRQIRTEQGRTSQQRDDLERFRLRREAALKNLATMWSAIVDRKRELRQVLVPIAQARRALVKTVSDVDAYVGEWPNEPQGYYVRARGRMYLGDITGAEQDVLAALKQSPDFRPGWSLLGIIKIEVYQQRMYGPRDTFDDRRREFAPLLKEAGENFERGWPAGMEQAEAAKWGLGWTREDSVMERVTKAFRTRYLDERPEEAIRLLAGDDYRAEEYVRWLGNMCDAPDRRIQFLTEAIHRAPGYEEAYVDRGAAKHDKKDLIGAIADFDKAIEIRSDFADAYCWRGIARHNKGDLDGAISDFDRALELRSDYFNAFINRAIVKQDKGDVVGAISDCNRAIEVGQSQAVGYCTRGVMKNANGDTKGAMDDYDRAIALRNDYSGAHYNRGILKHDLGDDAGAIADYDRAILIRKDYAEAYCNRGISKHAKGDLSGAIADYGQAIGLQPDSSEAHRNRGDAKLEKGDLRGAIADYDRAIELKSDDAVAYMKRAIAKQLKRDFTGAITDFDRAVNIQKDDPLSLALRGEAKQAMGDFAGAAADYKAALRIAPHDWHHRKNIQASLEAVRERIREP